MLRSLSQKLGDILSLVAELQRRRVFRALVGYGIAAFAVLQIIEPIMHGLHWPDAVLSYVVAALAVGFPVVVVLAWAFDVNASGVERASLPPAGASHPRGAWLVLALIGLGTIAAAPGIAWYFLRPRTAQPARETGAAGSSTPSVAVLPFVNLSSDKEQEYFSDGIAEEILNALAQVEGLRVIGRTSSFSFKGKNEDLRSIGEKLGVAHVLEGSVRKEGNRLRISAQLITAADGSHLWSRTFDRELAGIFALQEEISQAVVQALKVKLLPVAGPARPGGRPASLEAYSDYLLARQFLRRGSPESYARAAALFEKVVGADAAYAPGWSGLASALYLYSDTADTALHEAEELEKRALTAADRAVAVGPAVADGYTARGWLRMRISWDWKGAEADLTRALLLAPGDATAHLRSGALMATVGRFPEAIAADRKALELDPLEVEAWALLGNLYDNGGQRQLGREALNRALEIAPGPLSSARELFFLELFEGHPEVALRLAEQSNLTWVRLSGAAIAHHQLGHPQESQAALDALIASSAHNAAIQIAEVYAWRGERDRAFAWLDRAYAQRDTGMSRIKIRPGLRPVRGDPRFLAMLKRMNLPPD